MYEDIVAEAKRTSEAAVRESQERVNLAVTRTEEADKKATEASKSFGEKWSNRINAMRRRAADRAKSTEMTFGHEDGPHPNDKPDGDELVSLVEPTTPAAADGDRTPPFGVPRELIRQEAQAPLTYGRHASNPESARFMSAVGPEIEEDHRPQPPQPPRRPQPPARRARSHDDDDDYSGQSWLEGR